jgi:hypothetical protein
MDSLGDIKIRFHYHEEVTKYVRKYVSIGVSEKDECTMDFKNFSTFMLKLNNLHDQFVCELKKMGEKIT